MEAENAGEREPLLTAANLMSLSRVPMGLAVWLAPASRPLLLVMMALAAVSDVLDGWLARRSAGRGLRPGSIGQWLDPVCDKAFVVAVLVAVGVALESPLGQLLLIGTRELLQLPLLAAHFLAGRRLGLPARLDYRAGVPGKLATVGQFAAIVAIVAGLGTGWAWCWTAAGLGVVSAGYYVHRAFSVGHGSILAE